MPNRYIHEGRFGLPKSHKTGAIVGTYPKPMFVLNFDEGGLEVVQEKVTYIKAEELSTAKNLPVQPSITAINLYNTNIRLMDLSYKPQADSTGFQRITNVFNELAMMGAKIPWKTIVIDPIGGFSEAVIGHVQATQSATLDDARKWAPMVGGKVKQAISVLHGMPVHSVVIMHATQDKNEDTKEISYLPDLPSKIRESIGKMFSQFFYSVCDASGAKIYTTSMGYVKGVGARWPTGLPAICSAFFKDIYGDENKL